MGKAADEVGEGFGCFLMLAGVALLCLALNYIGCLGVPRP